MKLCIFIIGSSACGKSTLAMEIHKFIAESTNSKLKPQIIGWGEREKQYMFTRMSRYSANLGRFGFNQCDGADSLSTKDRIVESYKQAIQFSPIVITEGIMATFAYLDFLKQPNVKLFLVHLDISPEENFKRLRRRRAEKKGIKQEEVVLAPKTLENLSRKLRNFKNLYRKSSIHADYHLSIDCEVLTQARTIEIVRQYMLDHILS